MSVLGVLQGRASPIACFDNYSDTSLHFFLTAVEMAIRSGVMLVRTGLGSLRRALNPPPLDQTERLSHKTNGD
ncbi:MAG: hypothetical protein CFE27_00895 [Alphaproteobacteria bacterium PA1]|nr:MAG: hypothetical protein CFE27_00895 [Alphaproteobacteria bacterium PA1]